MINQIFHLGFGGNVSVLSSQEKAQLLKVMCNQNKWYNPCTCMKHLSIMRNPSRVVSASPGNDSFWYYNVSYDFYSLF